MCGDMEVGQSKGARQVSKGAISEATGLPVSGRVASARGWFATPDPARARLGGPDANWDGVRDGLYEADSVRNRVAI